MGTFIEGETSKYNNRYHNHEYENVIVQGQIIDAKNVIRSAIEHNKKHVAWYYDYENYDSFLTRRDDIFPNFYSDTFATYKTTTYSTCGEFRVGVCRYFYDLVFNHKAGGPSTPDSFDYAYVERKIKKELQNLGCKQVELFIGPKTLTVSEPVGKKSLLTGKYKYQNVNKTVYKWMISISW